MVGCVALLCVASCRVALCCVALQSVNDSAHKYSKYTPQTSMPRWLCWCGHFHLCAADLMSFLRLLRFADQEWSDSLEGRTHDISFTAWENVPCEM